jgi:hypothetical protein
MSTEDPYAQLQAGAGPDGGTLLGFLASVGALVAFTRLYADKRVTLHWEQSLGWRGRILIDGQPVTPAQIPCLHASLTKAAVQHLFTLRRASGDESYATITQIEVDDAAQFLKAALQADANARQQSCATLSGWMADQPDDEVASSSRLCALTGGSQQNFLETALHLSGFHPKEKDRLQRATTEDHLRSTLLEVWQFKEPMPGCRWEAQEDRYSALRHARSNKKHEAERKLKTGDYNGLVCTQRGANRLGIEAMACFPLMPGSRHAETTGFRYDKEEGRHQFTWPVWECPLTLESVRVLVAHPELTEEKPSHQKLLPLGVSYVFRTTRVTKGKGQVSFTIAQAVETID